ncbi:MAG: type II toxin-antitoxin system PemK/MazF family toxin [Ignavibacteriaceae bacterium]|nr:type II toxin-antitoxin system PemK/MazF family toxin [Ignavibacteriaceae bacterium]
MILTKKLRRSGVQQKEKFNLNRIFRGEVYYVDLEPTKGAEMQKERRCVIVSNNSINFNASVIIICPITDSYGKNSPIHIPIPESEGGLTKKSVAHCGQIRAVDVTRLGNKSGELSEETMRAITKGIACSMDVP